MTEYLYDKENPRSHLRFKPQGWESFYKGMPNNAERSEMIARRLMKDNDGDLSKFSMNLKKPWDKAQRWRQWKNMSRMAKNPIAFTLWRYNYAVSQGRGINPLYLFWIVCMSGVVYNMAEKSKQHNHMMKTYRYHKGAENYFPFINYQDYRLVSVDDTTNLKKKSTNFNAMFKNPHSRMMTEAYWCRDQNFRKYFQMRKEARNQTFFGY